MLAVELERATNTLVDKYMDLYKSRYGALAPKLSAFERTFLKDKLSEHGVGIVTRTVETFLAQDGESAGDTWFVRQGHSIKCLQNKWHGLYAAALLESKRKANNDVQRPAHHTVKNELRGRTPFHVTKLLMRLLGAVYAGKSSDFAKRLNTVTRARSLRDRFFNDSCPHCFDTGYVTLQNRRGNESSLVCNHNEPRIPPGHVNKFHVGQYQDLRPSAEDFRSFEFQLRPFDRL